MVICLECANFRKHARQSSVQITDFGYFSLFPRLVCKINNNHTENYSSNCSVAILVDSEIHLLYYILIVQLRSALLGSTQLIFMCFYSFVALLKSKSMGLFGPNTSVWLRACVCSAIVYKTINYGTTRTRTLYAKWILLVIFISINFGSHWTKIFLHCHLKEL